MDDTDHQPDMPPAEPARDAIYVVTHAFGEHAVGDEVNPEVAEKVPSHAVVRRGQERQSTPEAQV